MRVAPLEGPPDPPLTTTDVEKGPGSIKSSPPSSKKPEKDTITTPKKSNAKAKKRPGPEDQLTDCYNTAITRYRPAEEIDKLAKTSKFNKKEIQLIYRAFKQGAPTGLVDEEGFKHIFSQFYPLGDANAYAHHVFNTFKHNHQGQVCFEDFLAALSTLSRGTTHEKLKWIFGLYDVNRDGFITKGEMINVVEAIYEMLGRQTEPAVPNNAAAEHVERIFPLIDSNKDGTITMDELVNWVSRDDSHFESLGMFDTVFYTNNKDHLRENRLVSE